MSAVHITVSDRAGWYRFECGECPNWWGTTRIEGEAIQEVLDHYHLNHPHDLMRFQIEHHNCLNGAVK